MGLRTQGFLLKAFPDLSPQEDEVPRAAVEDELHTADAIEEVLRRRVEAALRRLRPPSRRQRLGAGAMASPPLRSQRAADRSAARRRDLAGLHAPSAR